MKRKAKSIEKIFQKDNQKIRCIIKNHPRSRNLKLSINSDGTCTVTKPFWVARKFAEIFVFEKFDWIIKKIQEVQENSLFSNKKYSDYKEDARAHISERIKFLNLKYGFEYNKIYIRDQKSRWGSCSSKGNLNFSYKLLFLPSELSDYIIVHELCHLREMNHSKKFWDLVGDTFPNHKELRRELRKIN